MVVVIPSYNNKDWYKKNLDSIFSQKYRNYRVIYADDASTDGTDKLVEEYIKKIGQEHRVTLIKNKERVGSLANLYRIIWMCDKNEIVCDVDGDDWLANDGVFALLNKVYDDPDVWLTYGQYLTHPEGILGMTAQFPQEVIAQNSFRTAGGGLYHLRTFYAGLFQKIKRDDLLYEGKFLSSAGDRAFILPIFEMAGKHGKFIADILYVYNRNNPLNDDKIDRDLQHRLDHFVRRKEKYQPILHYN